jgi:hypothetical protein
MKTKVLDFFLLTGFSTPSLCRYVGYLPTCFLEDRMNQNELLETFPSKYKIVTFRAHRDKPTIYVLADEGTRRVGVLSIDGGKTWKEVWEKE